MHHIPDHWIAEHIHMSDVIPVMRTVFRTITNGDATVPQRINMPLQTPDNALIMPVHIKGGPYCAVKVVSINRKNHQQQLPLIHAMLMLFDAETGQPLATMDAETLTALRTGAGAGLASDICARPDSQHLVLFGSGLQALHQFKAMMAVLPIRTVRVIARNPEKTEHFCQRLVDRYRVDVQPGTLMDLAQADVICTATTSDTPLFPADGLTDHVHINAVGSYQPGMIEIGGDVLCSTHIVVDQKHVALQEAGELVAALQQGAITTADVRYELGELVEDASKIDPNARSIFKSVGNAAQDLGIADLIYRRFTSFHK